MAHAAGAKIASGSYEPEISELLKKHLKEGALFIDIGANVGYFARLASPIIGEKGTVYAFEAEPENFLSLSLNSRSLTNVICLNFAVSDKNAFLNIYHSSHSSCHSIIDTDNHLDGSQFTVPTISMDHFWNLYLNRAAVIDLIKIDVEGAEMLVLNGMKDVISSRVIKTMIIEFCPKIIRNAGYNLSDIYETLASDFSISVIEREYQDIVEDGNIENRHDFDLFSRHLLELERSVNVNLLCSHKQKV